MAAQPTALYLDPDDEIVLALKRAARDHQLILVKTGDVIEIGDVSAYPVEHDEGNAMPAASDASSDESSESPDLVDPLLSIIGTFSSGDPGNDVAQDKYKYLAEAYLSNRE